MGDMLAFTRRYLALLPVALLIVIALPGCHGGDPGDVTAASAEAPGISPSQARFCGDLNGNGQPDVSDAIGILRIVVGFDPPDPLADCNADGSASVGDAIALLRCVVGLDGWPICTLPFAEIIGPDGQVLVWVPAGSFLMGTNDGNQDAAPRHEVTLDGFWIGQCEVTNAQYRAFCDATGWAFPAESDQGDDHPVACASWDDAQAYCAHYGYILPTEAQWEYAAAGPAATACPWGEIWQQEYCCYWENRGPEGNTFAVGSFPLGASWCGALDMAGNILEWCADWYGADYYQVSPTLNPPGPANGTERVFRGGSWAHDSYWCLTTTRSSFFQSYIDNFVGFRVARADS